MGAAKKPTRVRKTTVRKPSSARAASSKKKATKGSDAGKKTGAAKKTGARAASKKKTAAKKATKKTTARKASRAPAKKTATRTQARKKTAPKARRPRKVSLSKEFLAETKQRLINERADLTKQLREIEEDAATESEDTGQHEDFADAGTTTFERERDLSIRNNVLDLIDQVTRALDRLEEGTYGSCENCGQPIAVARIKAFPRVLMCLDCKRRDERTR